jgi:hypothetical protein
VIADRGALVEAMEEKHWIALAPATAVGVVAGAVAGVGSDSSVTPTDSASGRAARYETSEGVASG